MPLKGVFNEMFCRETSRSVKKSKRKKMQEGFYACNTAPYGYKKDPDEPGKLIIDINSALIVKKIFELKLEDFTEKQIAVKLNAEKIQTPAQYLKIKGMPNNVNQIWTRSSVARILRNSVYIGECVRGKTQNISYKSKKRMIIKRKDYIITPNTHQPIISKEIFEQIHNTKRFGTTKQASNRINTKFGDFMYCTYCKKKMQKRIQCNRINLHCSNNRLNEELCDFNHNYFYDQFESLIIEEIKKTFEEYFKDNTLKDRILKKYNDIKLQELTSTLKENEMELKKITFKISKLYNDRLNCMINEESYKTQYLEFLNERKEKETIKEKLNKDLDNLKAKEEELITKTEIINNLINKIKDNNFTVEDVKKIIKKIEIGRGFIIINFNFSDINDRKISCSY